MESERARRLARLPKWAREQLRRLNADLRRASRSRTCWQVQAETAQRQIAALLEALRQIRTNPSDADELATKALHRFEEDQFAEAGE